VFSVATPLTEAEETVRAFAASHLRQKARAEDFLGLAGAICGTVEYQSGITEVTSTAAHALELGRGVCQDHAHLFIACCRARGVPARYVSGYVDPGHGRGSRKAMPGRRLGRRRRLGERGRHAIACSDA